MRSIALPMLALAGLLLTLPSCAHRSGSVRNWSNDPELSALNQRLTAAYLEEDVTTLRSMLSDQHVHNNVFGMPLDKDTFLGDIESGVLEFEGYETPEIRWYRRGDVAIATGLIDAKARRGGKPVPASKFLFTRIFVRAQGQWKVLLFHNTMAGKPPGA